MILIGFGFWFVVGMGLVVFTSNMAEHRTDPGSADEAMANSPGAWEGRLTAANYDAPGRRLLPWYRVGVIAYWATAVGWLWWWLRRG